MNKHSQQKSQLFVCKYLFVILKNMLFHFCRISTDVHNRFDVLTCETVQVRTVYLQTAARSLCVGRSAAEKPADRLPGCPFDRSCRIKLPRCHSDPVSRVLASEQKIGKLDGRCYNVCVRLTAFPWSSLSSRLWLFQSTSIDSFLFHLSFTGQMKIGSHYKTRVDHGVQNSWLCRTVVIPTASIRCIATSVCHSRLIL